MSYRSALRFFLLTTISAVLFAGLVPALPAAPAAPPAGNLMVSAPTDAEVRAIGDWYNQHVPARFRAKEPVSVSLLTSPEMTIYLDGDNDGDGDNDSPDDSDGDIDGVFQDGPPSITLRLPDSGQPDPMTFAHEYGHYLWFDVFSPADRQRYAVVYAHQKSLHRLITDYANDSLEEGFAEAFSFYAGRPAALQKIDPASFQFLAQWPNS